MTDIDLNDMLRASAQRFAEGDYAFAQRWAALQHPLGHSPAAWQAYAGFGWLALRLPEALGGVNADACAVGALMEVAGSHLLMEPLLASAVLGTGLLQRTAGADQQARWLPAAAQGRCKLAFADEDDPDDQAGCVLRGTRLDGGKVSVLHGDVADRLIVSARDAERGGAPALCLVDPAQPGVQRSAYRLVDNRGAARLRFHDVAVERLEAGDPAAAIEMARDEAATALCAEALGVVRCLVDKTREYLKVRVQFGQPIGTYQVLQHRLVDMFLLLQDVAALTRAAERAMDGAAVAERARLVSGAKAYVGMAARRVANDAVQLHGGLGITDELDISHYFRRVMVIDALFGSRDAHARRFTDATLADL